MIMMDTNYWLYLVMYVLQLGCILVYTVSFIKTAVKYMLFSHAEGTYKQWKFSLTIGSVAVTVGIIGLFYLFKVSEDLANVMPLWVLVLTLYLQTKAISKSWNDRIYKRS